MSFIKIILGLLIVMSSCKTTQKSETTQKEGVVQYKDPLKEIGWLKEIKRQFDLNMGMAKQRIVQYNYNNQTVFLINDCMGCADAMTVVYDAKKNILCESGGIIGKNTCPDFSKNATNEKVLYEK